MSDTPQPRHPAQTLLNFVVILLTPMFFAAAGNDLALARQAATETLNAYRAETQSDLITIAKIIGFGLATLTALSLSMTDDLPLRTILRLHASANASDRSEHRNRQSLKQTQPYQPAPMFEPPIDEAALAAEAAKMKQRTAENLAQLTTPDANPAPAPKSVPRPAADNEQIYNATWAASAAAIAAETAAALPGLPPTERRTAAIWVDVLNEAAKSFMAGDIPPRLRPGDLAGMMAPTGP